MLTEKQKMDINVALRKHDYLKNSYFWVPAGGASGRRAAEREHNITLEFEYKDVKYKYVSDVSCSCKNFYYKGSFLKNGERKSVRLFKNLLKKES